MNKIILIIALFLCILMGTGSSAAQKQKGVSSEQLSLLSHIITAFQQYSVVPVSTDTAIQAAIYAVVDGLDPHSSYLSKDYFDALQHKKKGMISGVGLELIMLYGNLTILSTISGSSAAVQGVQAGDQIIRIQGEKTGARKIQDLVLLLRGPVGSQVVITVKRPGFQVPLQFTLVRDIIDRPTLSCQVLGTGGVYIKISDFEKSVTGKIRLFLHENLNELQGHGLILDLRDNPGGKLPYAVTVADIFFDSGSIVTTVEGKSGKKRTYRAHAAGKRGGYPVIVLVNGRTASAAEVLAAALQDHKRAIILGTATFGKGTIQKIIPLIHGGAIQLTTGRYYTPTGRSLQAVGIVPDILMPLSISKKRDSVGDTSPVVNGIDMDNQLKSALDIIKVLQKSRSSQTGTL
ncbi:MAG: peptidase S41 [Desulfocapsa sp.]|nr:MAG: peptidase S41 [Desulfocapsa sp.]